jgi:CubicO group peptidase (beta-lactamase class C family)
MRAVTAPILACAILAAAAADGEAQTRDYRRIAGAVDSIVADALRDGRAAGMSVAVVMGHDTIVLKGYGHAELEHRVPTPDRALYEIGSVTKQFTAAAVIQLHEAGALDLDDDLTKHLPDYPAQGRTVTLRRLLDHTSGIRGYTELPEFGPLSVRRLARDSLVALFSAHPFDFEPGDALIYNNSGYFLLGLIIERVSGMSYEEYVREHLFRRAGMEDSGYCDERAIVSGRAHGYDMTPDGLRRAAYLDHTWPYAAGSLCSTAGDLVAWNRALHGGRILSPAGYRELTTPRPLNDGVPVRYAGGLLVDSVNGQRVIEHGGGINGFLTDVKYFPDQHLTIAVLVNTAGPVAPKRITRDIAGLILGGTPPESVPLATPPDVYAGEYRGIGGGGPVVVIVAPDSAGTGITAAFGSGTPTPLRPAGGELFMRGERDRFTFIRTAGDVTALHVDVGVLSTLLRRNAAAAPAPVSGRAAGTFEVSVETLPDELPAGESTGRATLVKRFRGDLEGTARGEMLTALTPVAGSAVYVAIERITGTLAGRTGSFLLHHRGVLERGAQQLVISVVPDSGTDGLAGITGTMTIRISDGDHHYDFSYTLPGTR